MRTALIAFLLLSTAAAQEQTIRTAAEEVQLDLVVRDKKGKPVRDLRPEEIELYDEGARQEIRGFRLVTGAVTAVVPGEQARVEERAVAADPARPLRLVSFVFDSLDTEARRLARLAAQDFIRDPLEANVYVGVFTIDHRLRVVQQFTNDRELLTAAIERATGGMSDTQLIAAADRIRADLEAASARTATLDAEPAPSGGRGVGSPSPSAQESARRLAEMTWNMLQQEDRFMRSQLASTTLAALSAIVTEQSRLPGRKTVIYWSMGMRIPAERDDPVRALISRANRAGVSFYTVDSRGLFSEALNASSTAMLHASAAASASAGDLNKSVTAQQVKAMDTALESINSNVQQALHSLAVETGGFLIANTNDFREPFRKVHEDISSYYSTLR